MEPTARASSAKPPAFPMPPKSALFSRLEAFLPVLASENEKLEAAIASGEGDRHNIEIPVPDTTAEKPNDGSESDEDEDSDVDMDASTTPGKKTKTPVIEMNFALGLMEEGGSDSSDDEEDDENEEIDLGASIAAARLQPGSEDNASGSSNTLQLPTTKQPTRPLIQELN